VAYTARDERRNGMNFVGVRGLRKSYGNTVAVAGLDFAVAFASRVRKAG
jgi:hypothetical protein